MHPADRESARRQASAGLRARSKKSDTHHYSTSPTAARAQDVTRLMERMGRALGSGDATAIARLWATPALMISDRGVQALGSMAEIEKVFAGAKARYHERGFDETIPEVQSVDWLTSRVAIVRVRWCDIGRAGREIGQESSTYTVRQADDGALKIQAVVMQGAKTAS